MNLFALMPVRNEDWIVGLTARAALRWVDHLIVLDHASTDQTYGVLYQVGRECPGRITILREPNPTWAEMGHRQRLLEKARELGATHIAIVDADEILTGTLLGNIRGLIEGTYPLDVLVVPCQNLRGAVDQVMTTQIWGTAILPLAFKDGPECCWQAVGGYEFHHRQPYGRRMNSFTPIPRSEGGVMHLQFVCRRRLLAKQALYKMQEIIRWPGRQPVHFVDAYYNQAVYASQQAKTTPVPVAWWAPYDDLMQYINLSEDFAPWQELECQRLWKEYGPSKFAGLDLFGVVK